MNKLKNYIIIFLLVVVSIFYVYVKIQLKINQKQQDKIETLDKNLQRVCTIANNLLIEKFRNSKGQVEVRRTYLPPEGKTTITISNKGDVAIKVKRIGFCFKPGIGVTWNKHPLLLSTKFVYSSRLGLIVNGGYKTLGVGISRHLDDAFFGWRPQNLEAFISYHPQIFEKETQTWLVGLRLSL